MQLSDFDITLWPI